MLDERGLSRRTLDIRDTISEAFFWDVSEPIKAFGVANEFVIRTPEAVLRVTITVEEE